MKKIIVILSLVIFLSILIIPIYSNATQIWSEAELNKFKEAGQGGDTQTAAKIGIILGVIRSVGTILSVVILMVLGIKYMLGSVEEKAEYKNTFKLYILGTFILFTGSWLPQFIYDIMQNMA